MDVSEIITELDDHGFADTSTARKEAVINDTMWEIDSLYPWPYLEGVATPNLTASNALVTVGVTFRSILSFTIPSQDVVLQPVRVETLEHSYPEDLTTYIGLPMYYYFIAGTLNVYPLPSSAYATRIRYLKLQSELTSASVESAILLPPRHHRAIVLGALSKLYAMEDDPELAVVFKRQYDERTTRVVEDLWARQYDRPDMVYDVFGDDGWDYV